MQFEMELNGYVQASATPNSKRFVVEDSITKVTSDGEPHGMMTMVAGLSGLLAAIIILAVLVSMIACRKHKSKKQQQSSKALALTNVLVSPPLQAQLSGNLNAAFAESTLTLDKHKDKQQEYHTAIIVERY